MIARAKHIVILGGGFGGVYAAMHLEKIFARDEQKLGIMRPATGTISEL